MTKEIPMTNPVSERARDAAEKLASVSVHDLAVGKKPYVILHALDRDAIVDLLASCADEVARLSEGLGFYADRRNWIDTPSWDGDPACFTAKAIPVITEEGRFCDCGDMARAALEPRS